MILNFQIEQQQAPGRITFHSRLMLNDATQAWSSSPETGGYHIGSSGRGFWEYNYHSDGSMNLILFEAVHRGGELRRGGYAMIIRGTQLLIAMVVGATGEGYVYQSAHPTFRGEVLWRLT